MERGGTVLEWVADRLRANGGQAALTTTPSRSGISESGSENWLREDLRKRLARRALEESNLPRSDWDLALSKLRDHPHQRQAVGLLRRWLGEFLDRKSPSWGFILESREPGAGKTHLAKVLVAELCRRGQRAALVPVPLLFDELRQAQRPESEIGIVQVRERYSLAPLLVLDDLAKARLGSDGTVSEFVAEQVWVVLNERYERRRPTISTVRCRPNELAEWYGPQFGEDIVSRLAGRPPEGQENWSAMERWVVMSGPDLRVGRSS